MKLFKNTKKNRNAVAVVILSIAGMGLCFHMVDWMAGQLGTDEQTVQTEMPILDCMANEAADIDAGKKKPLDPATIEKARIAYQIMFPAPTGGRWDGDLDIKYPAGIEKLKMLFVALWKAESDYQTKKPGKAGEIGGLQAGELFWLDACEYSGAGGPEWSYADRRNPESIRKSIWVCWWYWNRYCPEALAANNWEVLIRVHNGGPRGMSKPSTLPAWKEFQKELAEMGGSLPDKPIDLSGGEPATKTPPGNFLQNSQTPIEVEIKANTKTETEWD